MSMRFENVDVNSLKNAINSCRNAINYTASSTLINEIMDGNAWLCTSRNNLKNAFSRLINEYYKDLENTLNHYNTVANLIEEYKEKSFQNGNLENEYNRLKNRLYYDEEYKERIYNEKTEEWEYETKKRTVKDTQVERQMQDVSRRIDSNKNRMSSLETTVYNMV